jgi:AraC-like DNA-binding protein
MDPLSEVLRAVRLTGGVFLVVRMTAPWCVISEVTAEDCRPYLETPAQIVSYHVITAGNCLLSVAGEPWVPLQAGEVVLLPRNDVHQLASAPGITAVRGDSLVRPSPDGGLARVVHGGGGALTTMVCGFLGSEEAHNPLLQTLPRALRLDLRETASRAWIEASVAFAAAELAHGRVASSSVMSRLSEVLLVEAVRHYAATHGEDEAGWLRGLRDPQIGHALALIHKDLGTPWSAEALAKAVAMSRSAFMERFTALVGMPPIRYLATWRLRAARLQLRETTKAVAQIAHAVGYESEEAFGRAFKRQFGTSPGRWRDEVSSN